MNLPRAIAARIGALLAPAAYRPAGGMDNEAMLGLPQSQGRYPLQDVYLGFHTRDHAPLPREVIIPVFLGFNAIPLETPQYDRGSFWRDDSWGDDWERGP